MKLTNSSNVPTELLREIVRVVCPHNVTRFAIAFKSAKATRPHGSTQVSPTTLVTISVPRDFNVAGRLKLTTRPKIESTLKSHLVWECFTHEERLVSATAQQLRYLWQRKVRGWRVWGARGRYSHRDACAYAIRMTRAWRRRTTEVESKFTVWKKQAEALRLAEEARMLKESPPIRRLRI